MRRALLALGIALTVIPGVIPAAGTLAANPQRPPHLDNQPPLFSPSRQDSSQWLMTKPIVPVTTRTVIPNNTVTGSAVVRFGLQYVGYRYTLIGNSPELGFSCIGFVSYVYRSLGIPLPGDLDNAMAYAPPVQFADLQPGDILWFQNTVWPGLSHTGIYLGGGRFVHAAWFNLGVIVSSFHDDPRYGEYWTAHYLGATRPWGGAGIGGFSWSDLPPTVRTIPNVPVLLVAVPALNVRSWWSVLSPIRTVVPRATPLTVMERRGHWYQIITPGGTIGWVASARLVNTVTVSSMEGIGSHATFRHHRGHARPSRPVRRASRRGYRGTMWRVSSRHVQAEAHISAVKHPHAVRRSHRRPSVSSHSAHRRPKVRVRSSRLSHRYERVLKMLRVRSAPSLRAHVLQLAIPGVYLRVLDRRGVWKHIQLPGGRVGYVYGRYVR